MKYILSIVYLIVFINISYAVYVVKVIDGDTIKVKDNNSIYNIRLLGIDAPENSTLRYGYKEKGGDESKKYLSKLIYHKDVNINCKKYTDKYNRQLCWVYCNSKNINKIMLDKGYAKKY